MVQAPKTKLTVLTTLTFYILSLQYFCLYQAPFLAAKMLLTCFLANLKMHI